MRNSSSHVPRSSRSRTFFHSSIPRGIDSITPRILDSSPKFAEDLESTEFPFSALLNIEKMKFKKKKIRNLSRFFWVFSVFQDYWSIFGIITVYFEFWSISSMLNFFLIFFPNFFEVLGRFSGFLVIFGINHSSKFPEDPEE